MQKKHALARVFVASGFALVALLAVAASAAVTGDATPSHVDWEAITQTANQQFLFN